MPMHLRVSEAPRLLVRGMGNLMDRLIVPQDPMETLGLVSIAASLGQNGLSIEQVVSMDCMCYDANDAMRYLSQPAIADLLKNLKVDLRLYGRAASPIQLSDFPFIQVYPTSRGLAQHNTLIEMNNGSTLVWHEPRHLGKNYFMAGSCLIDITAEPEEKERMRLQFAQLRQGKELSPDFYSI